MEEWEEGLKYKIKVPGVLKHINNQNSIYPPTSKTRFLPTEGPNLEQPWDTFAVAGD